jgi:hypothetical protein
MLTCRLLGHQLQFWADGEILRWECERECGFQGEKRYASTADAQRYARSFDRRDADSIGRRPTLSLLPLWLARRGGQSAGRPTGARVAPSERKGEEP